MRPVNSVASASTIWTSIASSSDLKVLILKPSSLGDVIQALPVLRLLKNHQPDSQIYWWLDSNLVPLLEGDPDLKAIIPFARRRWAKPRYWREAWRSLRDIRNHRFDLVIDLQGLARSAIVAWLANGAYTLGVDDPREGAAAFYDHAVPRPSPRTHAVDWYLSVLKPLAIPTVARFEWLPQRVNVAQGLRQRWPYMDDYEWIAVQPGARWSNKRWPIESFTELARQLVQRFPRYRLVVLGGSQEKELGEGIAKAAPERILDLTGRIDLPEMVEWIRHCQSMISNDTGPMHVAAALGKPVVALFGPTDPSRTGPYLQSPNVIRHDLPCAPCMKSVCTHRPTIECLTRITPEEVLTRLSLSAYE